MRISLIITAFNAEKFLAKALDSFFEQKYVDKELVIVDGISTDGTHQIIENYQKKYPNSIKWIKEKDSGISHARNIALKHVSGDLVGFLGADDFLHKNFYEELIYYANLNPGFDVIYCNSYTVGNFSSFDVSASVPFTKRNLIKHCPIGSGESFYYRRAVFDDYNFNEKNRYSMDYELNMSLVSNRKSDGKKYNFYPVNISAVFNLHTGENISSASAIKQRIETIKVQLKYSPLFLERLRIFWRGKKLIWRNFSLFLNHKI